MGRLVDTSVFIHLERRRQPTETLVGLYRDEEEFALSVITASELLAGVHRSTADYRARREAFVEDVLSSIPVVPMDLQIARVHALLVSDMGSRGIEIGEHDMIIAATAIAGDYVVTTQNMRDFNRVPGLRVEQPQW